MLPAHMEGRESDTLVIQAVNAGRFQERVPLASQLSIALIIGQHHNDVRFLAGQRDKVLHKLLAST